MYSAASRNLIAIVAATAILSSCGEKESTKNAKTLLTEAKSAITAKNYDRAITLIDSVSKAYPEEIDIRKEAMRLRPDATEGFTIAKLSHADSLTATLQSRYDSIARLMVKVDNPELVEGYWVASQGRNPNPMSTNVIEGRVTSNGEFYMVSSLNPSSLHHHSFSLTDKGGEIASTDVVPYDGEMNYRINGGEVVTYMSDDCKEIGPFAAAHRAEPLTVTFHGEGDKRIRLSAAQTSGLATTWEFAKTLVEFRHWSIERERLNRQLAIARDQKARLATDAPTDDRQAD